MGSEFIHERHTAEALNSCAFISTKDLASNPSKPFSWAMEMLMLGVGVGFDTKGAGKATIRQNPETVAVTTKEIVIDDSREGWASSVDSLIRYYLVPGTARPIFNYSKIRPEGSVISGFGGIASGPQSLINLHSDISGVLEQSHGKSITSRHITDIMNMIGKCVVAGNVRRSAELALGEYDDQEFLNLKNYDINPERVEFGWASNNSIFVEKGMDYSSISERIVSNGEPGLAWMDNARNNGRMNGQPAPYDNVDGGNPCQPAFATVLTPDGIKTFNDIGVGSKIWGGKDWTTVTAKWSTGIKPVYNFSSSFGEFIGTENHRVLQNGEKVEASTADHFDAIAGPQITVVPDNQSIVDGLVIGDGSKHKASNNLIFLLIGANDKDYYSSEISEYLIDDRSIGFSSSGNCEAYTIKTTITPDELPSTYDRRVPERFLYSSDKSVVTGFLRGIFSANGCVTAKGQRVSLKQTSHGLIRDVQKMLSSVGIRSFVTVNKPSKIEWDNGTYESRQSYGLEITSDRNIFASTIGFIQQYKNDKISGTVINRQVSGILQNIEFIGDMEVFDITVDNIEHVYWTGGLVVSNCLEQLLVSSELCNLVELYPTRNEDLYDFLRSIKVAYLYAKSVTLLSRYISDEDSRNVMMKNRRIGASITGIAQFIAKNGVEEMRKWMSAGYDEIQRYDKVYSMWLDVPRSIRTSTLKPSGSVSLLSGVTPGVHFPHSEYYIRRVRVSSTSNLWMQYKSNGYVVEDDVVSPNTKIIEFPIHAGEGVVAARDVSIWQQLEMAAMAQKYWSDNSVSVTITFDPKTTSASEISFAISMYEDKLKAVSFLPNVEGGAYAQMPYEKISKEQYEDMMQTIERFTANPEDIDKMEDKYCDGDACAVKF